MNRIAWATDIHLDYLSSEGIDAFCEAIARESPDGVLLSGDIAVAPSLRESLYRLQNALSCPIYFVLGNHDFYHGSIEAVRREMTELSRGSDRLHWLPAVGIVELCQGRCLLGHDGWADAGFGNYDGSSVMLNDYRYIEELAGLDKSARWERLKLLGEEAAEYLSGLLAPALERYAELLLLTHVPPFKEACRYRGQLADDHWLPHFSCKAVGETLFRAMQRRPDRRMTVLCGHTHHFADVSILPNLRVRCGTADYGAPTLQEVFPLG